MPDDNKTLNPQITGVFIGTRNLRKVSVYPLAMADQLTLNDLITKAFQGFFNLSEGEGEESLIHFISYMLTLIQENIGKLVDFIVDEGSESFLKDVTNQQALEIAEVIYKQNYESISKKVQELFPKTGLGEEISSATIKRSLRSVGSTDTN